MTLDRRDLLRATATALAAGATPALAQTTAPPQPAPPPADLAEL